MTGSSRGPALAAAAAVLNMALGVSAQAADDPAGQKSVQDKHKGEVTSNFTKRPMGKVQQAKSQPPKDSVQQKATSPDQKILGPRDK